MFSLTFGGRRVNSQSSLVTFTGHTVSGRAGTWFQVCHLQVHAKRTVLILYFGGGNCWCILSRQCYNLLTFWVSMVDAFYQSLICFFIPYLVSHVVHSNHTSRRVELVLFIWNPRLVVSFCVLQTRSSKQVSGRLHPTQSIWKVRMLYPNVLISVSF